jgi:hypothetical protein
MGFDPTIPMFERAKTISTLYHSSIVNGANDTIANIYKLIAMFQVIQHSYANWIAISKAYGALNTDTAVTCLLVISKYGGE